MCAVESEVCGGCVAGRPVTVVGADELPAWVASAAARRSQQPLTVAEGHRAVVARSADAVAIWHVGQSPAAVLAQVGVQVAAATHQLAADVLGVDVGPSGQVLSWQRRLLSPPVDDPVGTARLLRALHDRVDGAGCPPAAHTDPYEVVAPTRECEALLARSRMVAAAAQGRFWSLTASDAVVVVHGEPSPSRVRRDHEGRLRLIGFGSAGVGSRARDVGYVATVAGETGSASCREVMAAYGPHPQVTEVAVSAAARAAAAARLLECATRPEWVGQGWRRLECLEQGRAFRFEPGEAPY